MSAGCYLLIRFDTRDNLIPAINTLGEAAQVSRWDAVDGYYGLILKLDSNCGDMIEAAKKIEGFAELSRCELTEETSKEVAPPQDHSQSYVFAEVEQAKRESVIQKLQKRDEVIACYPSKGDFDIVAIVSGEKFGQIDWMVNRHIRLMDGILRVKQDRIIYKDKM